MPAPHSKAYLEIRKLDHLALRLCTPSRDLLKIAASADRHYKMWQEPKKNGGFRTISAPLPYLKKVQSKIHKLLQEIKIDDVAHCGIKGRSNLSNAKRHVNQKWLLSLDFSKFFPSISHHRVYNMFVHDLKCSPAVASLLTRLSTLNGEVPQGGPMSTDIANLVCRKIDRRLKQLALQYGIVYTRYCDDLSFSGQIIPDSFIKKVKDIIRSTGFRINKDKESLTGKHQLQIVTGLSVNLARPKVPRKIRRKLRAEKYIFNTYEFKTLPKQLHTKREQQIRGKIAYHNYIDKM